MASSSPARAYRLGLLVAATLLAVGLYLGAVLQPGAANPAYGAATEQGQAIFAQKCQGCHTVGGGRSVGPDLKDVTARRSRDWLIRKISAPDRLVAENDPITQQLVAEYRMPMPNLGVSAGDAAEIVAYIEAQSGPAAGAAQPTGGAASGPAQPTTGAAASQPQPPPPPPAAAPKPQAAGDPAAGKALFTGEALFRNGGVACAACHNAPGIGALGGGSVARDLTPSYANLGEPGLTSVLKNTPFPIMKEAYAGRPLTDEEAAHLVAFLREAPSAAQGGAGNQGVLFFAIGALGCAVLLLVVNLLWRGRLRGVRRPLVRGRA